MSYFLLLSLQNNLFVSLLREREREKGLLVNEYFRSHLQS